MNPWEQHGDAGGCGAEPRFSVYPRQAWLEHKTATLPGSKTALHCPVVGRPVSTPLLRGGEGALWLGQATALRQAQSSLALPSG